MLKAQPKRLVIAKLVELTGNNNAAYSIIHGPGQVEPDAAFVS